MNIKHPGSILLVIISSFLVQAQYYLDSEVSGHLPAATFIVKERVIVPSGKMLVVPAGAEFRFADSAGFDIYGGITVGGTPTNPVMFGASAGKWKGIRIFNGNEQIILKDMMVANCIAGIYLSESVDTLRLRLENVIFRDCETVLTDGTGKEYLDIQNKAITGTCISPEGDCSLLQGYRQVDFARQGIQHAPPSQDQGFTLRRPTLPEKIGIAAGAVAIMIISLKMSTEYRQ